MLLINYKIIFLHFFKIEIKKTFKLILIHDIKSNIHNNVNYIIFILLILRKLNRKSALTQI